MDSVFSVIGSYIDWDVRSLLLFTAVFILTADYIKNRRPHSFPPGPRAFPVVGNIFTVDYNRTHESMTQLAGKYGDVYSLRMGQTWIVVLNRFEVLKEALVNQGDSLVDRPDSPLEWDIGHGLGVGFSNGNTWKQQRRFALSTLKYFGFGKKSLEPVILNEFMHCAKDFISHKGKPFNPHLVLNNAVSNIICTLVFGHRFEYSDEKFIKLMKSFGKSFQLHVSIWVQLYNSFPLLMRRLPGPHQTVLHIWNNVKDFIRMELKQHRQNWDPSDQRDFIDCYLNEIEMLPRNAFQPFLWDCKVFPGQMRYIIPSACSALGPPTSWTYLINSKTEAPKRLPDHILNWPLLTWRSSTSTPNFLLDIGAPPPISKAEPSHPTKENHFGRLYPQSYSFGYYPKLMIVDLVQNVVGP